MHAAMKHAHPVRTDLKVRTVFNLLGPLTNPAGATAQLAGAPSAHAARLIAKALADQGRIGVPLYLYYAKGAATPQVLPQLLTPSIVAAAVDGHG